MKNIGKIDCLLIIVLFMLGELSFNHGMLHEIRSLKKRVVDIENNQYNEKNKWIIGDFYCPPGQLCLGDSYTQRDYDAEMILDRINKLSHAVGYNYIGDQTTSAHYEKINK